MAIRIITALLALPLAIAIIYWGGIPFYLAITVLSILGLNEFFHGIRHKKIIPMEGLGYIISLCLFGSIGALKESFNGSFYKYTIIILFFGFLMLLIQMIVQHKKYNFLSASTTIAGILYVIGTFLCIYWIRVHEVGRYFIWFVFTSSWGSDTLAYFTGYYLGKRKLCPEISPNKTIEGALGGIVGGIVFSMIFGYIMIKFTNIKSYIDINIILLSIIIGFLGSIFSQLGDLIASNIKRYVGIKDYGKLFPGHGGILDRFDSVIFVAPVLCIILSWILK